MTKLAAVRALVKAGKRHSAKAAEGKQKGKGRSEG